MIDPSLKSSIIGVFKDFINQTFTKEKLSEHIDLMWDDCIDQKAFGYSAHYEAIVWKLPQIFRIIRPLVISEKELLLLFQFVPDICKWLPYTSEEDYMSYTHKISTYELSQLVEETGDFNNFIFNFNESGSIK